MAALPELYRMREKQRASELTRNRITTFFPDAGPYRRDLYPKHLEFFRAGKEHKERVFLGGNRSGKTIAGAYETALHLTGQYPAWWEGKQFNCPTDWWVAGDTNQTTRDILQVELLGKLVKKPGDSINGIGTGMIPADAIIHHTMKNAIPNAVEQVWVKHRSGGRSTLAFKSYEQGPESFYGTTRHGIWVDEEVPIDCYTEMLMRTMPTGKFEGGILILTFTPLRGITELVQSFLDDGLIAL